MLHGKQKSINCKTFYLKKLKLIPGNKNKFLLNFAKLM